PREYVSANVTLGYALTVHAAQGLTVDTCYPIITSHTTPSALYVGMTRGRHHNIAFVVTAPDLPWVRQPVASQDNPHGHVAAMGDTGQQTSGQILEGIMRRESHDIAAIELQHQLLVESASMPVLASRWSEAMSVAGQQRFDKVLQSLVSQGRIGRRF